jgi:hypothetical protein
MSLHVIVILTATWPLNVGSCREPGPAPLAPVTGPSGTSADCAQYFDKTSSNFCAPAGGLTSPARISAG